VKVNPPAKEIIFVRLLCSIKDEVEAVWHELVE